MRAVYIESFGGTEVLRCWELPRPARRRRQVLVEVHAAGVNPRDWLVREGRYQMGWLMRGFPLILGSDMSGVVVETAASIRFRPGDAVFGMQTALGRMGCHAEFVAIAESALARKPEGRVRSLIDSTYALEEVAAAHERSRSLRSRGKLVLRVR